VKRRFAFIFILAVAGCQKAPVAVPSTPPTPPPVVQAEPTLPEGMLPGQGYLSVAPGRLGITRRGETFFLALETSHDLTKEFPEITRAVIGVHGIDYYPAQMLRRGVDAASLSDESGNTIVLAPHLFRPRDVNMYPDNVIHWQNFPFWGESSALLGSDFRISSFEAMDEILAHLLDSGHYPNLRRISIVGHSGGGQYVHRYSLLSELPALARERGIDIRFVVLNPSSYVYFSEKRADLFRYRGKGEAVFGKPSSSAISLCPRYNEWPTGLENLSLSGDFYVSSGNLRSIRRNYPDHRVYYLIGTKDNFNDGGMLVTCAANMEGVHRLERAELYYLHLLSEFGSSIRSTQEFRYIDGAGHSDASMFRTREFVTAVFFED